MANEYRPPMFNLKKWTIIVVCTIYIALMAVVTGLAGNIVKTEPIDVEPGIDEAAVRKLALIFLIVICVISCIFQLFGLCGAYFENYCLIITYLVLLIIGFVGTIISAIGDATYWASVVLNLILIIVCVLFVRDLRQIRRGGGQVIAYPQAVLA